MSKSKIEDCFSMIDDLIDRDILLTKLHAELDKKEYNRVKSKMYLAFGSISKCLRAYGLYDINAIPTKLEIVRCFEINSKYKVIENNYESKIIKDLYNITDSQFKKISKEIIKDIEKDALDEFFRDKFPFEDFNLGNYKRSKYGNVQHYMKKIYGSYKEFLSSYDAPYAVFDDEFYCDRKESQEIYAGLLTHPRVKSTRSPVNIIRKRAIIASNTKKYSKNNPTKIRFNQLKRYAIEKELPQYIEYDEITKFNNNLKTRKSYHIDHFIPISSGHGGSYAANLVIIPSLDNLIKSNKNPIEWYRDYYEGYLKFAYKCKIRNLASENLLTVEEFEEFVNWCMDNKRTIEDINNQTSRDGRLKFSLELWREATKKPFPLPSYVYEYKSISREVID